MEDEQTRGPWSGPNVLMNCIAWGMVIGGAIAFWGMVLWLVLTWLN